jgi:23S rRNA C2498 (ribose-2'-O)-methylase RlmM
VASFVQTMNPPEQFVKHLTNLVGEYNKRNAKFYMGLLTNLKPKLEAMSRAVLKYRQSVFCSICNWNAHAYINP